MESSYVQFDGISTVQLCPFGEDQWQRIVTYSPIYDHWTDMVLLGRSQRPSTTNSKTSMRRLNSRDMIDINALKLEDELLLAQLNNIKKSASISRLKTNDTKSTHFSSKAPSEAEYDSKYGLSLEDYHSTSSGFFQSNGEVLKKRGSLHTDSSIHIQTSSRRPVSSNQVSNGRPWTGMDPTKRFANTNKYTITPSLTSSQIRRAGLIRDHASTSGLTDQRTISPFSLYSASKRTAITAYSSQRPPLPYRNMQTRTSAPSDDANTAMSAHERLTGESLSNFKRARAKSSTTSRTAMHLVKAKNERNRAKQQNELKNLLGEAFRKSPVDIDSTLEEAIPNSIDVMHKMCGPATAFERNLRQNYHRQLHQFRHGGLLH